ncbi:MAG: hypothetical protein WAW53_05650, partial [Candidatus Dormiibacterota bacterium]
MTNQSWRDSLLNAREAATRFERAWPSLAMRICGRLGDESGELQPLRTRLHLTAADPLSTVKMPVKDPPILQALLPSRVLGDLLAAWLNDHPYRLDGGWTLLPPPHDPDAGLRWFLAAPTNPDLAGRELLEPLPQSTSGHAIYWLEGAATRLEPAVSTAIRE